MAHEICTIRCYIASYLKSFRPCKTTVANTFGSSREYASLDRARVAASMEGAMQMSKRESTGGLGHAPQENLKFK